MAWLEMNNIICLTSYHHFSHAEHKRLHSVAFIIVARSLWPNMGYVEQPGKCKLVQLSERALRLDCPQCDHFTGERERESEISSAFMKFTNATQHKSTQQTELHGTPVNCLAEHRFLKIPGSSFISGQNKDWHYIYN